MIIQVEGRMMRIFGWASRAAALGLAAAACAGPATSKVVDAQANGFQVDVTADIAAPPEKVWAALVRPRDWWPLEHTWSHDPKNLSLDPRLGGCLCETLPPGGNMRHLQVIWVQPGQQLVLEGGMGPMLFSGTLTRLIWKLAPAPGGHTTLSWQFFGGGYWPGGYQALAPVVDSVATGQVQRLKAYVETGKPS